MLRMISFHVPSFIWIFSLSRALSRALSTAASLNTRDHRRGLDWQPKTIAIAIVDATTVNRPRRFDSACVDLFSFIRHYLLVLKLRLLFVVV
ncbi:MAG: hypothetical protein LC725_12375, partial [Lentisphaerae bacterium]|nr:hypothetical protein [Lentisphaerota bacterium]